VRVSALAARAGPRSPGGIGRRLGARALIAFFLASAVASPGQAAVGAVASVFSDDRFRGISLSDGQPVAILDLSYDAPNGLYAAVSGSVVVTRDEGLKALGFVLNGGYAKRFSTGLTADVGIVHSRYSHYSGLSSGRNYSEVYAGLSGKLIGARVSISPNYLGGVRWMLHGEVNGHVDLMPKLLLDGTIGLLVPLQRGDYNSETRAQMDARIGLAQRIGPITFHAAFTTRTGHSEIYSGRGHRRTALVVGISSAL
jgi:uncharacterized protein (TIGR02001 family)